MIKGYLKYVGPVVLVLTFIGIFLLYDLRLIYLLLLAGVIWLLSKAFSKDLTYGDSYHIGIYAMTLGLIVELILGITGKWTGFSGIPFMFTVITLLVVIINYFRQAKS